MNLLTQNAMSKLYYSTPDRDLVHTLKPMQSMPMGLRKSDATGEYDTIYIVVTRFSATTPAMALELRHLSEERKVEIVAGEEITFLTAARAGGMSLKQADVDEGSAESISMIPEAPKDEQAQEASSIQFGMEESAVREAEALISIEKQTAQQDLQTTLHAKITAPSG